MQCPGILLLSCLLIIVQQALIVFLIFGREKTNMYRIKDNTKNKFSFSQFLSPSESNYVKPMPIIPVPEAQQSMYRNTKLAQPVYRKPCVNIFSECVSPARWPEKKLSNAASYPGDHLPFGYKICKQQPLLMETHQIENSISFHEYASKVKRTANTMTPSDVQKWKSKIPMIYINIESKKERNEHMKKTFSNLFGTIIRSEGVLRDNEEVQNLLTVMKDVADPTILAITLSHLNAIKLAKKTITELNNPLIQHAVIMEDDVDNVLMPFWQRSLDEIVKTFPSGWEVVQLAYTKVEKGTSPLYSRFAYPRKPSIQMGGEWGTIAYIISKAGMDKILRINVIELYHKCYMMTADDCLLGFNPSSFYLRDINALTYTEKFTLHPPMFTVNTNIRGNHRTKDGQAFHGSVANAGKCGTFYQNILYYNLIL
jgi:hypothetical protein